MLAQHCSLFICYKRLNDDDFRTQGEKLSISSFLRSKSGPLGCLEKVENIQRPYFGRPVSSPEKKCKPRPILPPPEGNTGHEMLKTKLTKTHLSYSRYSLGCTERTQLHFIEKGTHQ